MDKIARAAGGFALGIAVGLAAGWALFHDRSPSGPPSVEGEPATAAPPRSLPLAGVSTSGAPTEGPRDASHSHEAFPEPNRNVPAEAVPVLLRRLEEAISKGDAKLFSAAAGLLVNSKDPTVAETFARLTLDESVDLPPDAGRYFGPVLATVRRDGLAAAARRRYEAAARISRSWITNAWLEAVAGSGTEEDVDWILDVGEWGGAGLRALARSSNPFAVARYRERLATERLGMESLQDHLRAVPDGWTWGFELATQALAGARSLPGDGLPTLLRTLAATASPEDRARLKGLLLSVRDDARRLECLPAVSDLVRRGLPSTEFDALLQTPRLVLEAIARGTEDTWQGIRADTAIYAIEYNRATWSDASARALEALASRTSFGPHAAEVARKVRAGLASRWQED